MTNWIILIVAGFFESCFAFCLGKMKGVVGWPKPYRQFLSARPTLYGQESALSVR